MIFAAALYYPRIDRGWKPYDEGTLAHAAERVLQGELPHRDFDDVYTGGLALLNAGAFRVLGADLLTPRLLLFWLYLLTVPAVYYLASRFLPPAGATLASLLALTWNVPIYRAAMPSWYNLLLGILGAAALIRYSETQSRRWVAVAGVLAGISCAMKITGLFFVAAALLWFVFLAQQEARPLSGDKRDGSTLLHMAGLGGFFSVVVRLLWPRLTPGVALYFLLPIGTVVLYLVGRELRLRTARFAVATPWRDALTFTASAAVPLAALASPYLLSGSLDALLRGALVVPMIRIAGAAMAPPAPVTAFAAVPLVWLVWAGRRGGRVLYTVPGVLVFMTAAAFLAGSSSAAFHVIVASMRWVPVVAVVAGVLALAVADETRLQRPRPRVSGSERDRRLVLFLLAAATALLSLVQYPFAHPIYLWFVAPLAVLTLAGVTASGTRARTFTLAPLAILYLLFSVQQIRALTPSEPLGIPRASLYVPAADRAVYQRAVTLLKQHSHNDYIWAGPDTPELYFLADRKNPTRHLFEFLAQEGGADADIREAIRHHEITAISINRRKYFSSLSPELLSELERTFPQGELVGDLEVRWR